MTNTVVDYGHLNNLPESNPVRAAYNPLAPIALILALLQLAVPAAILAHVGLHQIRTRHEQGRAFAITALVVGYLEIAGVLLIVLALVVLRMIVFSAGVGAMIGHLIAG